MLTKKRRIPLLVQSDSSGRSTRRMPRHTRQKHRFSQSKGFGASFGQTFRRNRRLSQSYPLVGLSSDELLRTDHPSRQNRRLSQSYQLVGLSSDGLSSDGSSFGRSVSSANHISWSDYLRTDFLWTNHHFDEASAQPITSIGRIILGQIIFGRTFFGRIILRSETLKIVTSHEWSRTARVTRSRSPTLVRNVIERDGRKQRKKLLYAQNPYVYVRTKLLYAQKPYVYVRTKSLYAQKPYVYVRIKSLYAQKPYVYVRIRSLYAQKPYVYVRIKPYIVCTSRTSYAQVASSA